VHLSWDSEHRQLIQVPSPVFFPDSRRYLAAGYHPEDKAGVYDVTTGNCLQQIETSGGGLHAAAFSRDGRHLLTADRWGSLQLWPVNADDKASHQNPLIGEPRWIDCSVAPVRAVAFDVDGKQALACSEDGLVRVWDTSTWEERARLQGPEGQCASFTPDGRQVLSGHDNGELRLWEVATGKLVQRYLGHDKLGVANCLVRPDGKQAVSHGYDRTIRVWDLASGKEFEDLRRFFGEVTGYRRLAISPDGQRYFGLHRNEPVLHLREIDSGKEIHRFEGFKSFRASLWEMMGVTISPDGRFAACGSERGLVYLFRLPE
jgi:WD40 repeat protein